MQNREEERPSEFKAEILQLPFVTVTSNKPVPEETTAEVTVQVKIENEESEIALQLPASKQTSSDISIVSSEENKLSQNTCLLESASEKLEHASAADISIATQVDGTLTVEAKRVEIAEVFNVHLPNPKGGKTFSEILIPCQTTEPLIPKKRTVLQNLKELPEATPTELRQLTKVKLLDKQGEDTLQELFIFLRDVTHRLVIDKRFGDFAKLADWYKVPEYETVIQQPMDLSATVSKIDLICSKALEHNPDIPDQENRPLNGLQCPGCLTSNANESCLSETTVSCHGKETSCVSFTGSLEISNFSSPTVSFKGCATKNLCNLLTGATEKGKDLLKPKDTVEAECSCAEFPA
ncbi:UNVERIFIED_CONTAM: hypothetical protein K2H54_028306 [Gekko kuhli]